MKQYARWIAVAIAVGVFALCGTAAADIPGYDGIPGEVDFHATWDLGSGWTIDKNVYNYDDLYWYDPPHHNTLFVDNEHVPEKVKHVWLEIDWNHPDNVPELSDTDVWLEAGNDAGGGVQRLPSEWGERHDNVNLDGYTWHWLLIPQPDWEKIHLPSGIKSDSNLKSIEVGTYCIIPEPGTVSLLLIGSLMLGVVSVIRRKK